MTQVPWTDASKSHWNISYEIVPGFFQQSAKNADPVKLGQVPERFSLVDDAPGYWDRFKTDVQRLNDATEPGTAYKVIFFGRHGEGFHNVAEQLYDTKDWDAHWSLLNGDGQMTWGPDAELTDLGILQAKAAHDRWTAEVPLGVPLPTKLFCSPLTRAADTLRITYTDVIDGYRPLIMENLREMIGIHTCDKRRPRSFTAKRFPEFEIEEGFVEGDELWRADYRETEAEKDVRIKKALDKIFLVPDQYIGITAHSGVITSALRVVGHHPYLVSTGGVITLFVKATYNKQ